MSYKVYVVMQARSDNKVCADMHKTNERFYLTPEEAQKAIDADIELAAYKHIVPVIVLTEDEYMQI